LTLVAGIGTHGGMVEVLPADERTRRILDAAVHLAEAGGFAAVRLRDVAQTSGVALGTVYKRFRSKEDLMIGVLSLQVQDLRDQLARAPIVGDTPLVRVVQFFAALTDFLCDRPNFGRAVIRASASGDPAMSQRMAQFNGAMFELGSAALCGGRAPRTGEVLMLDALQHVWFAALCGWAGAVCAKEAVVERVTSAARLMTYGIDRLPELAPVAPVVAVGPPGEA
jgi:AcrR family transcriptional regulator